MPRSKNSSDSKAITEAVAERLAVAAIVQALGGRLTEAAELLEMPDVRPLYVNLQRRSRLFGRLRKAAEKAVKKRLSRTIPRYLKIGRSTCGYSEQQILDWMDQVAFTIASKFLPIEEAAKQVGVNPATFVSQRARKPKAWQEALKRHGLGWEQPAEKEAQPTPHVRARLRKAAEWAVLGFSFQFISRNFELSDGWLANVVRSYPNYWRDLKAEAAKAWGIPEDCTARTLILNKEGKVAIHGRKLFGSTQTSSEAERGEVPRVFSGLPLIWDKQAGKLRRGRKLLRKVDLARAPNLVAILDAFAKDKWATMIADPLCVASGQSNPERLAAAVQRLNLGLKTIRFGTEGGDHITWRKQ
ncbi:MAG TPA: hypothetical protein VMY42_09605 [Thermoguttaceae bacterium]|nr:hypothetical protein [Thermoguttaceae bacterium]